jgi:transposase
LVYTGVLRSQPDDENDKCRFGHSRDKRNDYVQVVIVLIVTPDRLSACL